MSYIIAFCKWLHELIARPFYYHIAHDSIVWQTAICFKGVTISYGTIIVIVTLVLAWLLHRNYVSVVEAVTIVYAHVAQLVQFRTQLSLIKTQVKLIFSKIKKFLKNMF